MNVVVEEVRDELCLLRIDSGDVLVLNRTAADVWALVSDGLDEAEVLSALAGAYVVSEDEIGAQVRDVLDEFEQRGFLCRDAEDRGVPS